MNTGQDNAQRNLQNRIFSDDFKKQKVKELDDKTIAIGRHSACQLVTLYSISRTTVYKWLAKYSVHYHKETKMVVQAGCRPMESETHKLQSVLQRQAELERIIGQKQMEIDFLNKLLEIGSHELKIDLKKSFSTGRHSALLSTGFPPTKENTSGK